MLLPLVAFAATLFAADPASNLADLNARLGAPTPELSEWRFHVGRRGTWSFKTKEIYSVAGLNNEQITGFVDSLMESEGNHHFQFRRCYQGEGARRVFEASGKNRDVFRLASELNQVLGEGACTYFCWDNSSLELRFAPREQRPASGDGSQTLGEMAASLILRIAVTAAVNTAAIDEEMRQKGVTPDDWKAAIDKFQMKSTLILTTDGKITADAPAVVSDDGKTLTLDLWKFEHDPPEKWSIRIDGL